MKRGWGFRRLASILAPGLLLAWLFTCSAAAACLAEGGRRVFSSQGTTPNFVAVRAWAMKVLKRQISSKDGDGFVQMKTEEAEDMWHAYNLIADGDRVRTSTVRKVCTRFSLKVSSWNSPLPLIALNHPGRMCSALSGSLARSFGSTAVVYTCARPCGSTYQVQTRVIVWDGEMTRVARKPVAVFCTCESSFVFVVSRLVCKCLAECFRPHDFECSNDSPLAT